MGDRLRTLSICPYTDMAFVASQRMRNPDTSANPHLTGPLTP